MTSEFTWGEALDAGRELAEAGFDVYVRLRSKKAQNPGPHYKKPPAGDVSVDGPFDSNDLDAVVEARERIRGLGFYCDWNGYSQMEIESSQQSRARAAGEAPAPRAQPERPGVDVAQAAEQAAGADPLLQEQEPVDYWLEKTGGVTLNQIEQAMIDNGVVEHPFEIDGVHQTPRSVLQWLLARAAIEPRDSTQAGRKQDALAALADLNIDPQT